MQPCPACPGKKIKNKRCRQIPLQAHWWRSKLCIVHPAWPVCFEPQFLWLCISCFSRPFGSPDFSRKFPFFPIWWKNLSLLQKSGRLYHKHQNSFRHITSMAWDNYIAREVETPDGDFSMNTSHTVDWVYRKTARWVHVFFSSSTTTTINFCHLVHTILI